MSREFTFEQDGLSYTVIVSEAEDGSIDATITMNEGSMDVNAVYWGDDDFSGPSANLGGPLNMNGGGSRFEGERIQWDDAVALSRPGLGREGADKETFLQEGESLSVTLDVDSIDDVDFIGIRATSVNGGDSIKGVSGNPETPEEPEEPEEPEDPEDPEDPEAATYGKVFFASRFADDDVDEGLPIGGSAVLGPDQENAFDNPQLPEGSEATFADYVAFIDDFGFPEYENIQALVFYDENLSETFRIEAPEGGFTDAESLLAAYEEATSDMTADGLFMAMEAGDDALPDEDEDDDELGDAA